MRFGFSYIGGGSGSGLALVYLLEASELNASQNSNELYNFVSLLNSKPIIQRFRIVLQVLGLYFSVLPQYGHHYVSA